MIKLETIKRIADDILSDVEWVNDSHSEAEYEGIKGGLNRLIRHIEETHEDNQIIDNGLIAEFMGMKEHKGSHYSIIKGEWIPNVELEYHESWDWLMPVVEKIESLRDVNGNAYRFTIDMCNAQIEGTHIEIIGGAYKLNTTYKAVVEFIKNNKL